MSHKSALAFLLLLLTAACARVTVRYQEEAGESRQITLPFSALETALHFSEDGGLDIEDLAGINESLDLRAIAQALRAEGGDKLSMKMQSGESLLTANVVGKVFRVLVEEDGDDHGITLNLPLTMLDLFAEAGDRPVSTHRLLNTLKKQKGLLIEVRDDDLTTQVIIK